jgi:signal transduction histidine kinase
MQGMRRTLDLRLAIILLVLAPLLLTFGVGGLIVLGTLENRLEARLQEDIALIARTLRGPMGRALDSDRDSDMHQALRSAFDFGRVYGVYVYDGDGELLTRADRLRGGMEPDALPVDVLELEREEEIADYRSMGGQDVFSYFTPLTDTGGQVIGMLQITRQASEMRDYINRLRWQVLFILCAFAVLFVIIVIVGHNVSIGRPMARLTRTMDKVTAGDGNVRAIPNGPREMRRLGERFNLMLNGIRERDRRLTDQQERQLQLAERLRQTEKYALAGRLAAGVAHELGAPLSVVDGHVQRLMREQPAGDSSHAALVGVRAATQRMAEVVKHLLSFGRGKTVPVSAVSVARLAGLAAADVRTLFDEAGTELVMREGERDVSVSADQSRLREALTHLLKNALHAATGGRVRLSWRAEEDSALIVVEDSGSGVNETDRERIFEPFYTTKKPGEGSGLGLAVVRGIIAEHGGEIEVGESDLGGAAFVVRLPIREVAA